MVMRHACGLLGGGDEHFFEASLRGGEHFFQVSSRGGKAFFHGYKEEGGRRDFLVNIISVQAPRNGQKVKRN